MVTKSHLPPPRGIGLDGREVDLLHYLYSREIRKEISGNPSKVISAINDYHSQFNRLMNVGPVKGPFITDLIAERKPSVMLELGGYVGYSAILFGDALRANGGQKYISIEENPEMAAVANQLVELAGLRDHVQIIVGSSTEILSELVQKLQKTGPIDMVFIDHCKEAYLLDLWLLEELKVLSTGDPMIVTDNVIYPGAPEYMEWVQATPEQKREIAKKSDTEGLTPNADLVYKTFVTEFETSFGKDGVAVTTVVRGQNGVN